MIDTYKCRGANGALQWGWEHRETGYCVEGYATQAEAKAAGHAWLRSKK